MDPGIKPLLLNHPTAANAELETCCWRLTNQNGRVNMPLFHLTHFQPLFHLLDFGQQLLAPSRVFYRVENSDAKRKKEQKCEKKPIDGTQRNLRRHLWFTSIGLFTWIMDVDALFVNDDVMAMYGGCKVAKVWLVTCVSIFKYTNDYLKLITVGSRPLCGIPCVRSYVVEILLIEIITIFPYKLTFFGKKESTAVI